MLDKYITERSEEFTQNFPFLNNVKFVPNYEGDFEQSKLLTELYNQMGDKIVHFLQESIRQAYELGVKVCIDQIRNHVDGPFLDEIINKLRNK